MAHWSDSFIGKEYVPGVYDCVHLLVDVQRTVFKNDIEIPIDRADSVFGLSQQVDLYLHQYFRPIQQEEARDGDMVLMKCKGRLNHTGVYTEIQGTPYVVHNLRNVRSVACHRLRDLTKYNMEVEGFYRFHTL